MLHPCATAPLQTTFIAILMHPNLDSALLQLQKLVRSFGHRPVHERETQTAGSQQKHRISQSLMTASLAQIVKVISKVSRKDHFALEFRFKPIKT